VRDARTEVRIVNERGAEHSFTRTVLFALGAFLIWLAAFAVAYVFAALACARAFADRSIAGLPIVPVFVTLTCALAAGATVLLLRGGVRWLRRSAAGEAERFVGFVAFATSTVAIIALVLLALPALLVGACEAG
jgi:hypothetical protein